MSKQGLLSNPARELSGERSPHASLYREPYRFDFFQAVRLLRWLAKQAGDPRGSVSADEVPQEEIVRFRALAAHAFPQGAIANMTSREDVSGVTPTEMEVAFLGLFGPNGVLPRHYTQLIIDRSRAKDDTLRDFLDLFNHRSISHFYRAWAKSRLPISYEESRIAENGEDDFGRAFYSLVGWGYKSIRDRLEFDDSVFVFYGGPFATTLRNATSLQMVLADYFDLEVEVIQFVGQWLSLNTSDQSRLSNDPRRPANNCLGSNVVVGERVWSVENNFRLRIGPMRYDQFLDMTPAGTGLTSLSQAVRAYVGLGYEFDVQLVLQHDEVPACRLANSSEKPTSRLGWNTWIHNEPFPGHVDDAVFTHHGAPIRP